MRPDVAKAIADLAAIRKMRGLSIEQLADLTEMNSAIVAGLRSPRGLQSASGTWWFLCPIPNRQMFRPLGKIAPMSKEHDAVELRAKAAKHRILGRQANDGEAAAKILTLAAELEKQARELVQPPD